MSTIFVWVVVELVMTGIMIKPSLIFLGLACCLARRKGDPARVAFSYMKAAFAFFIAWLVVWVAADAVSLVQVSLSEGDYGYETDSDTSSILNTLYNAYLRLISIGLLFQYITDVVTVVCLVELGNGFLYCLRQGRTSIQTGCRWGVLAVGFIVLVLVVAWFGLLNAAYSSYFNYENILQQQTYGGYGDNNTTQFDYAAYENKFLISSDLETACDVLLMVVALATVGYASYVLHICRAAPVLKDSAVLFLVAAILNLLREAWNVGYDAAWNLTRSRPSYAEGSIVDPILNEWSLFVLLVLVFVIGRRKIGGLWSNDQPWMKTSTGFNGAPAAPLPMQQAGWQGNAAWQQQPQQPNQWPPHQFVSPQEWRQSQTETGAAPAPGYSPPPAGEVLSPTNGYVHEVK